MFAFKSSLHSAIPFRLILTIVILFNAVIPTAAYAGSPAGNPANVIAAADGSVPLDSASDSYAAEASADAVSPAARNEPTSSNQRAKEVVSPALALSIDPDVLTPGGSFTLSWKIEGVALGEGVSLSLQLPDSFSLEGTYAGQFDPASHILTIPITALTGQVHVKAGSSTEPVTLTAVLSKGTEILADANLSLATHEKFVLDAKGGSIEAEDGKVNLQFPKGVFPEKTVVDIGQPSGDEVPPYSLSGRPFEIKAHGQQSKNELDQFSQEITISASYADLGIPETQEDDLYLYWYNSATGDWEPLPTAVDKETKTLVAVTNHFTVFDIDVSNWQASRLPTVDAFQVSNFTGAGTYSMPIVIPPGPGGFQPNLALSYNSQVIDQSTTLTQASWVGMGWSLDTGSIELDSHATDESSDDTYFLNVSGVSTMIIKDGSGAYHAGDENFWKMYLNGGVWTVLDKQGNKYFFEHVVQRVYRKDDNCLWQPYHWSLTKVRNIFGVEINYTYQDQTKQVNCNGGLYTTVTATYPTTVTYAGGRYRVRFERGSRLDYPAGWDTDIHFHAYQQYRLQNIYVEQDLNGDGNFETILRRYAFQYANDNDVDIIFPGYTWTMGGKTTTLRSVQEYGVGGTTTLPATTFTYGDNLHLTRAQNGYGGAVEFTYQLWYDPNYARPSQTITQNFGNYGKEPCMDGAPGSWMAREGNVDCTEAQGDLKISGLTGIAVASDIWNNVNSDYKNHSMDLVRPGGVYRISASMDSVPSGSNYNLTLGLNVGVRDLWAEQPENSHIFILPADASKVQPMIKETGATGGSHYARVWQYTFKLLPSVYRVTKKSVSDGLDHTYEFTYSYANEAGVDTAAVNTPANSPNSLCTDCDIYTEWYSEFRGHGQVTETGPDGRQTITTFYQNDLLKGRPIETRIVSGSQTLTSTLYQYTPTQLSVTRPIHPCLGCQTYGGVLHTWVTNDWVEKRVYANDGSYTATRQTMTCEPNYGNLVTQADQVWDGSTWNIYRSTTIDYFPNATGVYLVGLPARQQIKDAGGNVIAESLNLYDSNTAYNTSPSVGKLSAVRTWVDGALMTGRYSQVSYTYDAWGNRTGVTTSSEYGTGMTPPAAGMRTLTTSFDPAFHVYPISQTTPPTESVPGGLTTTWNYDYDNNGIDDYILGLPTRETDPNGNIISARYDVFGRMTRLIRPGDSSSYPTVVIDYHDANPFWTQIRQRVDSSRYLTIRRHYDGIGRQTYIENGHTTAGNFSVDSLVSYQYPAFNIVGQSMPYASGGTAFYMTTESDALGRPVTVTAPNGNSTSYSYDGLVSTVLDAKGYSTTSAIDEWGRVHSVTPPTGPEVTYAYDELNSLSVAERGGVTTSIEYDHAGRKVSMSDPDMGDWGYAYDAIGNLTLQTDARGCSLNLEYDPLNRLLTKNSSGETCGTQVHTLNTYDVGTNGLGQRTSMNDDSGSTSWGYDERGRMIRETKTITGSLPFTTSWTYNSADMPATMTYPDSEILTYQYNNNGQLDSVSSSLGDTYMGDATYDEAGRLTSMDYGAGVVRKIFQYFPWDTPTQGGLLDSAIATRVSDQVTLQSFAYTYDGNANVSTITDALAGPQTQTFTYDELNRLIGADASGGTDGLYSELYAYDVSTGNLAAKGELSYSYNDTAHAHAVTNAGTNTYTYDANGNMIERIVDAQTFNLAYDAENRLIGVQTASQQGHAPSGKLMDYGLSQPPRVAKGLYLPAYQTAPTETPTPTATSTEDPTATVTPSPDDPSTATPTPTLPPIPGDDATDTNSSLQVNGAEGAMTFTEENGDDDTYTISLLHTNGANGSTAFTDEVSARLWSTYGNARMDTSQKVFGSSSAYFDGSGDYLYSAPYSDFNFGAQDFTIDFWVKRNGNQTNNNGVIGTTQTPSQAGWKIYFTTNNALNFSGSAGGYGVTSSVSVPDLTWTHVAVVRDGNLITMYFNGAAVGSSNISGASYNTGSGGIVIGRFYTNYNDYYFNGWLDEVRISRGIARWTSNFTPPVAEYASIAPPSNVPDPYTISLLHMNGADGSTTFMDESGKVWTSAGNSQIDTGQSKFGAASGLFDGSGDYISTPDSADWNFGTGDFTIDFWVRFNSLPGSNLSFVILNQYVDANNQWLLQYVNIGGTKTWRFAVVSGGANVIIIDKADNSISTNTWYHIALVRSGNQWYWFRDGTQLGTASVNSDTVPGFAAPLRVGDYGAGGAGLNGWLEEVRISKGIARWIGNFTPPVAEYDGSTGTPTPPPPGTPFPTPLPGVDDAYTISLLHLDGANGSTTFTDESGKVWTRNGNTHVDTGHAVFGGASGFFDGSGDYLSAPDSNDFELTGEFTIEARVRFNALPAVGYTEVFFAQMVDINNYQYVGVENYNGTYNLVMRARSGGADSVLILKSTTLSTNTWYHFAFVRYGSDYMIFKNGVQVGTTVSDTSAIPNYAAQGQIGALGQSGAYFNGWMDEVRISRGIARWLSNFTVPAWEYSFVAPNLDDTYTVSLLHMNGEDGSRTFADESRRSWDPVDNVKISSAKSVFGGKSGLFDGTNDYLATSDSEGFNIGSGDWTVDYWVNTTGTSMYTFGQAANGAYPANGATTSLYGTVSSTGKARIGMYSGTTAYYIDSITSVNDGAWHHIAGIRHGSTLYIAVDGVLEEDIEVGNVVVNNSTSYFSIGALGEYASNRFNGSLDEFRFSKGIARWTADFEPPTSEYAYTEATPTPTPTTPTPPTPTETVTPPPAPTPFEEAVFTYDGDGKRVKSVINGITTTYFVGAHYEVTGGVITKYYYAGTQRIAMRTGGTLNYLLGDHLGSTSITVNALGNVVSEMRYTAWGEVRFENGTTPTKYTYTGQYSYAGDFGLMFYNARWYDPSLGRFAQADTVVPKGSQGYDRYAYASNSPLNYVDPTGHFTEDAIKKYLLDYCKGDADCANNMLEKWKTDKDFWNMITDAQGGDVIFGTRTSSANSSFTFTFAGDGQDELSGITGDYTTAPVTLVDIQNGHREGTYAGGYPSYCENLDWIGFYRPEKNGAPTYWHVKPGYGQTEGAPQYTGTAQGVKWTLVGLSYIAGKFTPAGDIAGVGAAVVTTIVSDLVVDAADAESNDYHVQVGPVYFNFQVQPDLNNTWQLEHTEYTNPLLEK